MNVRVAPHEPNPTHHIALRDRAGKELGIILCDENAQPLRQFSKNPVQTTALKQTSGSSSYDIFDYPYSPIVQDDLSGGRGNADFERDSTKYYDSYRAKSGRANKAYAGPQENYTTGARSITQSMPGSVSWHILVDSQRYIYKRIQSTASYTVGLAWLLARKKGEPADLTIAIYSDSAGSVGSLLTSVTVADTRMNDILSEWLCETISQAVTASTYYWLIVYAASTDDADNHWKIGVNSTASTTYTSSSYTASPTAATFDLYYRLTTANTTKTCIPFTYKEAQYFVISGESGAPSLYLAGDRGTADANTAQLTKLIDATKSWTTDEWAGQVVMITTGTGRNERITYRTITSNTSTVLTVSEAWTITHDTTTEYVILGSKLTEITGHGLTAPVTDVLVSTTDVIYFAMGDSTTMRRAKFETSAGTWTATYADETATTKATFMKYMPLGKKILIFSNYDASGNVSLAVMSNASVPTWGTALTWAAAITVGSKYIRINGVIVHPTAAGTEACWIFKEDSIWTQKGGTDAAETVSLDEFATVRSQYAGINPLRHGVYLYFPLQYGLERYYGSQFDDIGPNLGEGLPSNRRGPLVDLQGYPGKFFAAVDAGATGYSSVLDSDGWHERYRAPYGQRIRMITLQPIPGTVSDRLWIYQGNDVIYLPLPSETVNELEDTNYRYTHEWSVTLSRMHAGMFDIQKLVKLIKLQTENLEVSTGSIEPVVWFEMDYRLNDDEDWTTFADLFTESPTQEIDLTEQYGLAAKRLQLRVRGYSTDNTKTAIFLAIIVNAVLRTDVKYMYPLTFRIMDNEPLLSQLEQDSMSAAEKLEMIEDWADASTDSMLKMESTSPLFHNKMIFLNPPSTRQIRYKGQAETDNPFRRDVYICSVTVQEA